jgi:hypothetical protein
MEFIFIFITLIALLIFIFNFKKLTILFLEFLSNLIFKTINYIKIDGVKLGAISYDEKGRFLEIFIENTNLLPHKKVLKAIYNKLMSNKEFLEFGYKKVILLFSKMDNGSTITFHPNVFISNSTPFDVYYKSIENHIQTTYDDTTLYGNIDQIPEFKVLVWNLDNLDNKNIKLTLKSSNKPFKSNIHTRSFSSSSYLDKKVVSKVRSNQ